MTQCVNGRKGRATRVRLRPNQNEPRLEKHRSLPELRIPPEGRLQFHCSQCGFTNTCFVCGTWSSQVGGRALEVFIPRVRHASSPSKASQLEEPSKHMSAVHDCTLSSSRSTGHGSTPQTQIGQPSTRLRSRGRPPSFVARRTPETMAAEATKVDVDTEAHNDGWVALNYGTNGEHITGWLHQAGVDNVATATPPVHSCSASVCYGQEILRDTPLDSSPLPGEETARPTVMPSVSLHTQNFPPPLRDLHDTKTDENPLSNLVMFNDNDLMAPNSQPRQHEFRSLRRRKHLNILQTSPSDLAAREPIPISLKLRSPASRAALKIQPINPTQNASYTPHDRSWTLSQQLSIQTDSSSSPVSPDTPVHFPAPPSTSPAGLSTNARASSPVRLGHPSRPYYTAIRKQGISPTSSSSPQSLSRASTSTAVTLAPPRRQSYSPSTSTPSPLPSTTTSRHLSMTTMFCSPAYPSPSENVYSVFSLPDDENVDDGVDESSIGPSPRPNASRFSFPRRAKDVHRKSLVDGIHSNQTPASQSQSLSFSRRSGYRGSGVGFSMSGQTELRMALATGATSAGIVEDGFRFRETVPIAPEAIERVDNGDNRRLRFEEGDVARVKGTGASKSFMKKVKKLRKGLKDILLMTSTTIN